MARTLSVATRQWLTARLEQIGSDAEVVNHTQALEEAIAVAEELGISLGTPISSQRFRLLRTGLSALRREIDFTLDYRNQTRRETAPTNNDEKVAGIKPTDYQVLVALSSWELPAGFRRGQVNIDIDYRDIQLAQFNHLVMVENRDSFYDWSQYQHGMDERDTLVVYRGDNNYSKGLRLLLHKWRQDKLGCPVIYFGDFDYAGIRWAMECDGVLLPELSHLTSRCRQAHLEDKQLRFRARLKQECPPGWRALFGLMDERQVGLRQQWMYDCKLVLWSKS